MCGSQTKESKTFTVSQGFNENVNFFDQPKQQKRGWAQILGYQKSGRGTIRSQNKKETKVRNKKGKENGRQRKGIKRTRPKWAR